MEWEFASGSQFFPKAETFLVGMPDSGGICGAESSMTVSRRNVVCPRGHGEFHQVEWTEKYLKTLPTINHVPGKFVK
jgi:hypothetical protein